MSIRRVFDISLAAFLVIGTYFWQAHIPQGMNPIEYTYNIQELFFRYGVVWLFGLTLFVEPLRKANLKTLGVLLLYVLAISTMISFDIQQRRQILNLFVGILFFKIVVENFDFKALRFIVWCLFGILLVNVIFCFLQMANHDPVFVAMNKTVQGFPRPVGLMRLEAHLGTMAAILGPLLVIVSPWLLIVTLPLFYFGTSSVAIVAFILSMAFVFWGRVPKRTFILAAVLILLAGVYYIVKFDMPGGNFGYRFHVWFMGLREVLTRTMFYGFGIGSWALWAPQTAQQTNSDPLTWLWAHNEYLQVFFELGIVGLIILLVWLKDSVSAYLGSGRGPIIKCLFASFISLALVSTCHFPFHLGRLAGISVFVLALFHAAVNQERKTLCA